MKVIEYVKKYAMPALVFLIIFAIFEIVSFVIKKPAKYAEVEELLRERLTPQLVLDNYHKLPTSKYHVEDRTNGIYIEFDDIKLWANNTDHTDFSDDLTKFFFVQNYYPIQGEKYVQLKYTIDEKDSDESIFGILVMEFDGLFESSEWVYDELLRFTEFLEE